MEPLITKFRAYFQPKTNLVSERYKFLPNQTTRRRKCATVCNRVVKLTKKCKLSELKEILIIQCDDMWIHF